VGVAGGVQLQGDAPRWRVRRQIRYPAWL